MKDLLTVLVLVLVLAAGAAYLFYDQGQMRQDPTATPARPDPAALTQGSQEPAQVPLANDTPPPPGTLASLKLLLARLYASSSVDNLIAGGLISQHLTATDPQLLESTHAAEDFFTLALSVNPKDPKLLFVVSDYCLSKQVSTSKFCLQTPFSEEFAKISGNNAIAWALGATRAYNLGKRSDVGGLLERAAGAAGFTDYWPEVMLMLLQAFQDSEYTSTWVTAYQAAFDIAPQAFGLYSDLVVMCGGSEAPVDPSWLTGCQGLGRMMQQSRSLGTTVVGLTIEISANQRLGIDISTLKEKGLEINELSGILNRMMGLSTTDSELFRQYLDEWKKHGEKASLKRFQARVSQKS